MLSPLVRFERIAGRFFLGLVIVLMLVAFFVGRAHAQAGGAPPTAQSAATSNLDVISWSLPLTCGDGTSPAPVSGIKGSRVETALSVAGPWTTLAEPAAPITQFWRYAVPPGTAYYAVRTVMTSGAVSPQTLARSPTTTVAPSPPPAPVPLVVAAPEVYNTGTFDPAVSWLVKRNKLYGTIPLGTECDEARPAKDGFYRVPASLVSWANPRAKTSYPLAYCVRKV